MRDYLNQALVAMHAYLQRGQTAIEKIYSSDVGEFIDLMRDQRAAFHNFRVAAAEVERQGKDICQIKEFSKLWEESKLVDARLSVLVREKRKELQKRVKMTQTNRTNFGKYRSGSPVVPRIEKPV